MTWLLPALSGVCVTTVIFLIIGWGLWRAIVKVLAEWIAGAPQ